MALPVPEGIVANRFLLWSLASLCAVTSIWVINVPSLVGVASDTGTIDPFVSSCMVVTALCGLGTVSLYWLTFFPPAWYHRCISRSALCGEA